MPGFKAQVVLGKLGAVGDQGGDSAAPSVPPV